MKVIEGVEYYSVKEVLTAADVSRQTLWRWRRKGSVPEGHRFRGRQILFSRREFDRIVAYANRIESPTTNRNQLALTLNGNGKESRETT